MSRTEDSGRVMRRGGWAIRLLGIQVVLDTYSVSYHVLEIHHYEPMSRIDALVSCDMTESRLTQGPLQGRSRERCGQASKGSEAKTV